VFRARDITDICLSKAYSDEWSGGVCQQGLVERLEKEARESEGYMVGGGSLDFVGLPYHSPVDDQGDIFQFCIWVRYHDTGGNLGKLSSVSEFCGGRV